MKIDHLTGAAGACLFLLFTGSTNAALTNNGNGLIYDDDLNITWLMDANYAMTSGYDTDGLMTWSDANAWANQLEYRGHIDWRLSPADLPCNVVLGCNGNENEGEMGYLYHDELMGNTGTSTFNNIQDIYWTSTSYTDPNNPNVPAAWYYSFGGSNPGTQTWAFTSTFTAAAWAVHDGDISAVPVPAAVWLFASGLLGLFGASRRA
jgi:hypothetical protein